MEKATMETIDSAEGKEETGTSEAAMREAATMGKGGHRKREHPTAETLH